MNVSRGLWCALLLALVVAAGWLAHVDGFRLDTRLADLAPRSAPTSQSERAARELSRAADAWGADALRFLVEPRDGAAGSTVVPSTVEAGAQALRDALAALPDIHVLDAARREAYLLKRLTPHRFSLLPDAWAVAIDAGDEEELVDRSLDELYAPAGAARPLALEQDPLNGFGQWLDERLATQPPAAIRDDAAVDDAVIVHAGSIAIDARRSPDTAGNDDAALANRIEAIVADVEARFTELDVRRTGVLLFASEAARASRNDIDRISIGSALGMLLLLLPAFRAARPLLMPAVSIATGAATGAALVWLVHGSMHVLTVVFGATLIGIAIDYSIHAHAHQADGGGSIDRRRLRRALTLGLLTSACGYAALGLSSVEALTRVALFSVGGLIGAWLTVIAWMPTGDGHGSPRVHLAFLRRPVGALEGSGRVVHRLMSRAPVAAAVGIAVVAAVALSLSRSDDDPRRLIDLSPALIEDARRIAVWAGEQGAVNDVEVARRLVVEAPTTDQLYERLAAIELAFQPSDTRPASADAASAMTGEAASGAVQSVLDWLPAPARMAADRDRSAELLRQDGPALEVLEALGEPDAEALVADLRRTLAADDAAPLRHAALFDDASLDLPPLYARAENDAAIALVFLPRGTESSEVRARLDARGPLDGVRLVDAISDTADELARQRRSALVLLLVATLAIAALLLAVYRRPSALLATAVPAAAIACTLALLPLLGSPITLFHTVALFLVLGLGMDYVIFLSELDAGAEATTRAAIVLSAATSLLSFGLLAASDIPVARFFGQTVFIGNAFNLVFTFVFLAARERAALRAAHRP